GDDVHPDDAVNGRVVRQSRGERASEVLGTPADEDDPAHDAVRRDLLAQLATLDARLLQQLAVLLLRHALAALLDDRTQRSSFQSLVCRPTFGISAGDPPKRIRTCPNT